jgi:predicted metal-binding protein
MPNPNETSYVVVIQCDRAMNQTCAGYQCEWAFSTRKDAFARYPAGEGIRYLSMSCGGCPGRAVTRKLTNVKKGLKKREQRGIDSVAVHLASCITRSSHHGPRCPHIDAIKQQVELAGFSWIEDSRISPTAEKRRAEGLYK